MQYIDIHSHLNSEQFDGDIEQAAARLEETDTTTIVVGTSLADSIKAVELAEKHDRIYACVGLHPVDDINAVFDTKTFEALLQNPKVVAIGECGLDFFHSDKISDFERQSKLFLAQVDFALLHDLPLMIHSRAAYPELLDILESLHRQHGEKLRGDIHFFAGTLEEAQRFWNIGFTTSFTGVITFATQYDEVIRNAPLDMLMSETDAPYVAPVPYRGKRNEPSYVSEVVKKIAEIRGEGIEVIQKALVSNAEKMFKISA